MDKRLFDEFRAIIYAKSGISISDGKSALVASRVNKRLRSLGLDSHKDYLDFLKDDLDGEETVHFLDVISTNTTKFFREPAHFEILSDLLASMSAAGQRRFRLWSCAVSTGEEAYTMAMTALDALPASALDVRILATDISMSALRFASDGVYDARRAEDVPREKLSRHFVRDGGGASCKVSRRMREMILFKRLNLSKPPFPMKGPMDIILCRNVMIYFDIAVRTRLVGEIVRLLRPGGILMTGHSESLNGIDCGLVHLRPSVYRKPEG